MGQRLTLRDEIEQVLRSWNLHEIERAAPPVIDFDCHPTTAGVVKAESRLAVRARLVDLHTTAAESATHAHLAERLRASLAYMDEILGARSPIRPYIEATQGCCAVGWNDEYLDSVRSVAIQSIGHLGIDWGPRTTEDLTANEGPIDSSDAPDVIRKYASTFESDVRRLTSSDAPFNLSIERVDLDEYWAYWLDGSGRNVRMRINQRNAQFTDTQAQQFALHEILGHGLQCASYSQECETEDVPWVRLTAVHAQQQVLLEGLAQAMPLFLYPDNSKLAARVRLAHYVELVRAKLHLALNDGTSIDECISIAGMHAPFWSLDRVGDSLSDRSANPLLRSYLWAYPAGIDWFINLADSASPETIRKVITSSYRQPLTPSQLAELWPECPTIGGNSPTT